MVKVQKDTKVVIFDMDGTMVDNMMVHYSAWQKKLKELGMDLPMEEVMKKVHGINEEIFERLFGNQLTKEEWKRHSFEKEELYRDIYKDSLSLLPGLQDFLDSCRSKNISMAVGSAAPPENVDFVLDNLHIRHYFEAVLHARHVNKGKPDPEIYLKIMDKLKCEPEECVIFEDSPVGAEAGVRSGVDTVVVTTAHEPSEFDHLTIYGFIKDFTQLIW